MTAEARREVIEQAALEVFAERGYHGASIDEIVRRAGVSPPVLSCHMSAAPGVTGVWTTITPPHPKY